LAAIIFFFIYPFIFLIISTFIKEQQGNKVEALNWISLKNNFFSYQTQISFSQMQI
jgi:hypothetical protein